jgi:Ycf66 protein N-terminus
VNFNTPALLFGLILLVASISLFIFGRLKPELQRDSDSLYAIVGVVCALILFGSAFDLSLGMSFQQLLMIGALIALMWQNIQARQPKNLAERRGGVLDDMRAWGSGREKSRRSAPMVDDDRRVYRAELDDLAPLEDPRTNRRIRGGREVDDWESSRRSTRRSEYADNTPRRPRGSLNGSPMVDDEDDRPRLRAARALPPDRSVERVNTSWDDDRPVRRPRRSDAESSSSRPPRTSSESSRRRRSSESSDYVDYQPLDYPDSSNGKDYDT